jgi:hypothetical protein
LCKCKSEGQDERCKDICTSKEVRAEASCQDIYAHLQECLHKCFKEAEVTAARMFVPSCKDVCIKCFKKAEVTLQKMLKLQDVPETTNQKSIFRPEKYTKKPTLNLTPMQQHSPCCLAVHCFP